MRFYCCFDFGCVARLKSVNNGLMLDHDLLSALLPAPDSLHAQSEVPRLKNVIHLAQDRIAGKFYQLQMKKTV